MAYTPCYPNKRNWANLPSESSPINETNLNAMDNAIYTNDGRIVELSGRLDTDETALGNKVDKQSGKGLSEIKSITISPSVNTGTKIAEISYKNQDNLTIGYEIKNGVVVDSALSSSSENPVQNKVVKSAIDAKSTVSISDTLETGDTIANLTINETTTAIKAPLVEVDDTPSATSENPLQNKAIYEMLNNLLPEETVQGNPISINDASGLNAKACSVDLLPIQDLSHGEPSPTNICPISGRTEVNLTVADAETSPTQTETYTETLGQTVYGGKVVWKDGVVKAIIDTVKHTLSASDAIGLTEQTANTTRVGFLLSDAKSVIASERMNFKCNNGAYSPAFVTNTASVGSCGLYTTGGDTYFLYHTAKVDSYDTAKANIIASGTEVSYYLATPTEITLTAEQISLLKGNNVISTDGDNIKLVYSADIKAWVENQLQS